MAIDDDSFVQELKAMQQTGKTKGKIIVFGIMFWYPLGGVMFQFLHYLLALRRLGYDVYYVEDSARWFYVPDLNDLSPDASKNVAAIGPLLDAYGFAGKWACRGAYTGGRCHGLDEGKLHQLYREADAFLNVTGAQELRDEHRVIPRKIYVESDPFVDQVRVAQGNAERIAQLEAHDVHFSFGENIGNSDCTVPTGRFHWHPTRQPVTLDLWRNSLPAGDAYRTITTWSNKNRSIDYRGETYHWTKDREFEKFLDLPQRRPRVTFEIATTITEEIRRRVIQQGWHVVDSHAISKDARGYQRYIQTSRGEFTVARDQYVRARTGWFSDRSACYLAAGRPVITQETAFSKFIPAGRGLHCFGTMDELLAGIDRIESNYSSECSAASELAAEYFDDVKVVGSLLERAGF